MVLVVEHAILLIRNCLSFVADSGGGRLVVVHWNCTYDPIAGCNLFGEKEGDRELCGNRTLLGAILRLHFKFL